MPVFGRSLFETVLDGLEETEEDDEPQATFPVRGLNAGFVGGERESGEEPVFDPAHWFDGFPPDPVPPVPDIPAWAGRLSDAEIIADLDIDSCGNAVELRERRRIFALENHPDRVNDDYRQQATRRMMIANQAIDTALARLLRRP